MTVSKDTLGPNMAWGNWHAMRMTSGSLAEVNSGPKIASNRSPKRTTVASAAKVMISATAVNLKLPEHLLADIEQSRLDYPNPCP
jgi:hypothetical protein